MSPLDVADSKVTERASPPYVPPLQRTEGQPPPIAANGGLSYMSFDREGDAGTAVASLELGSRIQLTTRARMRSRQRLPSGPSNRSRPILRAVPRAAST